MRIWDRLIDEILTAGLPILPLALVSNVELDQVPRVLLSISDRIATKAGSSQPATLWNATRVLMGPRDPVSQVNQFIEGISAMLFGIRGIAESFAYQDILQKREILGRADGGIDATGKLPLRLRRRKFGSPPEHTEGQLNALHDFDQRTEHTDRVLDVSSSDELLPPDAKVDDLRGRSPGGNP